MALYNILIFFKDVEINLRLLDYVVSLLLSA